MSILRDLIKGQTRARLWSNVWPVMISRFKSPPNPDFAPEGGGGGGGVSRNIDRCIRDVGIHYTGPSNEAMFQNMLCSSAATKRIIPETFINVN